MVLFREKRYAEGVLHHFLLTLEGQVALETRPIQKLKVFSAQNLSRNISTKKTFNTDMVLFQSMLLSNRKVWDQNCISVYNNYRDVIAGISVGIMSVSASPSFVY